MCPQVMFSELNATKADLQQIEALLNDRKSRGASANELEESQQSLDTVQVHNTIY